MRALVFVMERRWFPWTAAAIALAVLLVSWLGHHPAPRAEPELPSLDAVITLAAPHLVHPPAITPPEAPAWPVATRAVPCLPPSSEPKTLRAQDGAPVVCEGSRCFRLDLERTSAREVAPPPQSEVALAAEVKQVDGRWAACRGGACTNLGPRLAAAVATAGPATATLDRSTVVVADQMWNVPADRQVALRPPDMGPRGPEHDLTVIGDVLLVHWYGGCVDSMCLVAQLVDRGGRELGWVYAGGRVLAIDDQYVMLISIFSAIEIRDRVRGTKTGELDPKVDEQDFVDAVRLDATHVALLRDSGDGVQVSVLEVERGDVRAHTAGQMVLPHCDD